MIASGYTQVQAEDVIVLGSPVEGIYLAARSILEPGDEVIVLTPAYDALVNMFEHVVGPGRVHRWVFTPTKTAWELDFNRLDTLVTPQTRLVVVNFPHNPTGFLPTISQLDQLVQIVEGFGLWLFYDEMYFGLIHSGTPTVPSAADLTSRAVVLSGLSKTYGLPGLRTGWLVVREPLLRAEILNWKFYTSICPPAPSEFLAMAAWAVRDQLRDRNIATIEHNLVLVEDFFTRWPGKFSWRRPMAGSVALVGMDVPSVEAYAAGLAAEAGVLILPASAMGWDDQHMRMGFGRAGFGEALQHFESYLQKQAS